MLAIVVVDLLPRMLLMCTGAEGSLVKKEIYKGYEAFLKCIMYFMTKFDVIGYLRIFLVIVPKIDMDQ